MSGWEQPFEYGVLLVSMFTCCVGSCHVGYSVLVSGWLHAFTLVVIGVPSYALDFLTGFGILWDERCYLNVNYSISTTSKNQHLWNWCCSTANLEKWFFLPTAFQDFNGILKRGRMILMYRKQFHLDSLYKLLCLKGPKPFLLVIQLELLLWAAVRLVNSFSSSASSHPNIP